MSSGTRTSTTNRREAIRRMAGLAGLCAWPSSISSGEFRGVRSREPAAYLEVVRRYVDTLLAEGRDHYGSQHSPLVTVALDRDTYWLPEGRVLDRLRELPRAEWGIRSHDRVLTGANPMHDQNLYQILYALADATRTDRYRRQADRILQYFFRTCQHPITGLMPWGEHSGWDFRTEAIIDREAGYTHEFFRPWVLWDRSFRLAPGACRRFAQGLWNHQIGDQATGNFSRHARIDRHDPGLDSEYPRHGGFYIATWAMAYQMAGRDVFRQAADTLLAYFDGRHSAESGAIPAESAERSGGNLVWPHSNLGLAVDLHRHAEIGRASCRERVYCEV